MNHFLFYIITSSLIIIGPGGSETRSSQESNVSIPSKPVSEQANCTYNGIPLYGKVQFVTSFPDIKIQYVNSFPDLKVKFVDGFADDCGEWQEVNSFPDFKVQVVESFPDIKIQIVDSFPGQ